MNVLVSGWAEKRLTLNLKAISMINHCNQKY